METETMSLREYFNRSVEQFDDTMPVSVMYYFNGDEEGYEDDYFEVSDSELIIDGDLRFPLDIVGNVGPDGVFEFEYQRDQIGIEFWF